MDIKSQEIKQKEDKAKVLFAMAVIVFDMIALIF
jgi:hypothetical protein